VRHVVESLRLRFQECQRADVSVEAWRALQLDILDVAKKLHQLAAEQDGGPARTAAAAVGAMLGEAFWYERDPTRLTCMIEGVIVELERQGVAEFAGS
jgi:hypothetical protein